MGGKLGGAARILLPGPIRAHSRSAESPRLPGFRGAGDDAGVDAAVLPVLHRRTRARAGRRRARPGALRALTLGLGLALVGCSNPVPLSHRQTRCIHPGDTVTVQASTHPGARLVAVVEDDFGSELPPDLPNLDVPSSGSSTFTWPSPAHLHTRLLHFLLTVRYQGIEKRIDIHVTVKQPGVPC